MPMEAILYFQPSLRLVVEMVVVGRHQRLVVLVDREVVAVVKMAAQQQQTKRDLELQIKVMTVAKEVVQPLMLAEVAAVQVLLEM